MISFNFIHSPHKWLPTVLSSGKQGSAGSIGFIPRPNFVGDLEDSKSTTGESYVLWEAENSSPSVGCASSKRQYLTVLLIQKLFRWMLLRTDGIFALDLC